METLLFIIAGTAIVCAVAVILAAAYIAGKVIKSNPFWRK